MSIRKAITGSETDSFDERNTEVVIKDCKIVEITREYNP